MRTRWQLHTVVTWLLICIVLISASHANSSLAQDKGGDDPNKDGATAAQSKRVYLPLITPGDNGQNGNGHDSDMPTGPSKRPEIETKPLAKPTKPVASLTTTAAAVANASLDARILVLAANGSEPDLPAIKQVLDYQGTPYEVFIAAPVPGDAATNRLAAKLSSGTRGFYQGIILTTDFLGYTDTSKGWTSALTSAEWLALANYEAAFGVRQVTWYTYPSPDYGFNWPSRAFDSTATPVSATFTSAGQSVFGSYVNTANNLTIQNAYTYLATPLDGNTTPLLSDSAGNALAAIKTFSDGRQNLALTFDSNQYLTHNLVLAYGLVNWVTKGLFLGERHIYIKPQPDDIFLDDNIWQPTTPCTTAVDDPNLPVYRMTGNDLKATLTWQQAKQAQPTTQQLLIEWPFNGWGTTSSFYAEYRSRNPSAPSTDTLTAFAKQNQSKFQWISHTWDHENLDATTYDFTKSEIAQNNQLASQWKLSKYKSSNLVTPDVSGLSNPAAMQAFYDQGVRYLVSDTSLDSAYKDPTSPKYIPGYVSPTPNTGVYNTGTYVVNGVTKRYSILMIPRYANNLFFNVTRPEEWVAEYNCFYGKNGKIAPPAGWGYDVNYSQLLDKESDVLLTYLLKGDISPLMFHQPNLRAYDGVHTLMGDLLDTTFAKYNALFKLPIQSPSQDQIGQRLVDRMQYNAAGVSASIQAGSITITAQKAARVPVTGCNTTGAELYGGQYISYFNLSAGQSVTCNLTTSTLTVTKDSTGTGTGSITSTPNGIDCGATCSATFNNGTIVGLTATPAAGSVFAGWSGACSGTGACTVTMDAARTVTARFNVQPAQTYALTVTKDGNSTGTVTSTDNQINCGTTCSASYVGGSTVTLTATPDAGSFFAGWWGCPSTASNGDCIVTMDAARAVNATFYR